MKIEDFDCISDIVVLLVMGFLWKIAFNQGKKCKKKKGICCNQWRTQEFCSRVGVGVGGCSTNSVEDRWNGDLGAVAP